MKKQKKVKKESKAMADTDLICRRCGIKANVDLVERYEKFMVPHWENCRANETAYVDLFEWRHK